MNPSTGSEPLAYAFFKTVVTAGRWELNLHCSFLTYHTSTKSKLKNIDCMLAFIMWYSLFIVKLCHLKIDISLIV